LERARVFSPRRATPVRPFAGRAPARAFPPAGGSPPLLTESGVLSPLGGPGRRARPRTSVREARRSPRGAGLAGASRGGEGGGLVSPSLPPPRFFRRFSRSSGSFTLNKSECSKRASPGPNTLAWDNGTGLGSYFSVGRLRRMKLASGCKPRGSDLVNSEQKLKCQPHSCLRGSSARCLIAVSLS
jgi:hypothetical protein